MQTPKPSQATSSWASPRSAEQLASAAVAQLCAGGPDRLREFDGFPVPVYATDKRGTITYFNAACADFAGREPTLGVDQWCISWKLLDRAGNAMRHDQCPMAIVVREGRQARGLEATAERPDGERIPFRAFPTPAIDDHGRVIGGVNVLVPLDRSVENKLIATADKCRNLAKWVSDEQASRSLRHMAIEYEDQAALLRLA